MRSFVFSGAGRLGLCATIALVGACTTEAPDESIIYTDAGAGGSVFGTGGLSNSNGGSSGRGTGGRATSTGGTSLVGSGGSSGAGGVNAGGATSGGNVGS